MNNSGSLIILAYPEEFVSMVPAWYKKPLETIGLVKNGMICAGHSACVLINKSTGILEYTDFGRYITPPNHGRARHASTDPDVAFNVFGKFDENGQLKNAEELIEEIFRHPNKTQGLGTLYCSINDNIDYQSTSEFIRSLNQKGSIPYGPFRSDGTNCSRYVRNVIRAGVGSKSIRWNLKMISLLTPSPLGNVFYGIKKGPIYSCTEEGFQVYRGQKIRSILRHLFSDPEKRPKSAMKRRNMAPEYQWLGGIGIGSWFSLKRLNSDHFLIRRLWPDGTLAFEEEFRLMGHTEFDEKQAFKFIYDCNAVWCTIEQGDDVFRFESLTV